MCRLGTIVATDRERGSLGMLVYSDRWTVCRFTIGSVEDVGATDESDVQSLLGRLSGFDCCNLVSVKT